MEQIISVYVVQLMVQLAVTNVGEVALYYITPLISCIYMNTYCIRVYTNLIVTLFHVCRI